MPGGFLFFAVFLPKRIRKAIHFLCTRGVLFLDTTQLWDQACALLSADMMKVTYDTWIKTLDITFTPEALRWFLLRVCENYIASVKE